MLVFHDYLISYRLTPRSRIMRKHLPKLSMVMEEDSAYEASSIMQSQTNMAVSVMSYNTKSKFIYREPIENNLILGDLEDNEQISDDSESSSEEIDEEKAMKDLLKMENGQELMNAINKRSIMLRS